MPIGRRPSIFASRGVFVFPNATASGAIRGGAAVAVVNQAGVVKIVECGSTTEAGAFQGFASAAVADGDPVGIVTLRGSLIAPIIEGGGALTPSGAVYLSATAGEVTQTPPAVGFVLRVGEAFTAAEMLLNTDVRIVRP
jgi:hypothetical protein